MYNGLVELIKGYIMSESKSLLARLLAKENITVQHGNYQTAYFDIKRRVLGLPLWKNDDKDLYDMLVGHEVGHALYTPIEGWTDIQKAAKDERVPGDYLNVVEDIRIERKVQEQYPGIVRSFKKGYSHLAQSDFFGLNGRDPNSMGLMDRINLKAKLRDLIDVDFTETETPLVKQAFAADTWEDVVEAARALYNYINISESQESEESSEPETNLNQNSDQSETTDDDPTGGDSKVADDKGANDSTDRQEDTDDESNGTVDEGYQEVPKSDPTSGQDDSVETYQNARKNQRDLLEQNEDGSIPTIIHGLTRDQLDQITIPFSAIRDARIETRETLIGNIKNTEMSDYWRQLKQDQLNTDESYKEFVAETKRVVNVMVKEFELRKAAYQYSRSSSSRSGALNMDKLHEHKINDDIFRRVTQLADAKSHGMVMLVDNSASMSEERGAVITQVLNMAMFCKRVNIPFDVYSFTTSRIITKQMDQGADELPSGSINHSDIMLTHMLSSSFSRKDYDLAYRQLYDISNRTPGSAGHYDLMSGTPLNDILSGMHIKLKDFKRKHQLQRVIFTVLADGDSRPFNIPVNRMVRMNTKSRVLLSESRQMISIAGLYPAFDLTKSLLDNIRKEIPGVVNIGYFVANSGGSFSTAVNRVTNYDTSALREAKKIANANKFVSYDSTLGYDRYFILRAGKRNLEASSGEFNVPTAAKRNEITRAFKKYSKSKKGNRVLATQLAEIIS